MLWSDAPATMPTPGEPIRAAEAPAPQTDDGSATGVAGETPDAAVGESDAVRAGGEAQGAAAGPSVAGDEVEVAAAGPSVAGDEAFLAEMAAEFDAIQAALARLDEGTFDRCQVCGGRIGEERLMADPLVTRCAAHA